MDENRIFKDIDSLHKLHQLLGVDKPQHPLFSIVNLADLKPFPSDFNQILTYQFFCISLIKDKNIGELFGRQNCDFDGSIMRFAAPRQLININAECTRHQDGYLVFIHPDFLKAYSLGNKMKNYGFFAYSATEALHLSEQETSLISDTILKIFAELQSSIDAFSQDIIVSHLDLLLNYTNRFYNRQFIVRKNAKNELLDKLDVMLKNYFDSGDLVNNGLPSVQCVANELNISPNYLSDILRAHTGLNAKQHIQNQLIEKSKELLATTEMTVAEIAYLLGFGYPQSFNKFFKSKTNISPLQFRTRIN